MALALAQLRNEPASRFANVACLVVDDNDYTRVLFQIILRDIGVRNIFLARSADEGGRILSGGKIDAVFTDYEMAETSGVEFVRRIRASENPAIRALPAEEARRLRETIRGCVENLRDKKRVREVDYQ